MRKQLFLWITLGLVVFILILAFENITTSMPFLFLFYETELSGTLITFIVALLGFFIGFFAMLYSFEKGREQQYSEQEDSLGAAPVKEVEEKGSKLSAEYEEKKEVKNIKDDQFEEDDEVLG